MPMWLENSNASTMQQMAVSFGVGVASLAIFIPDRFHSISTQMVSGVHKPFLCLGALPMFSGAIFRELKTEDGDTVSLHKAIDDKAQYRQS